MSTHKKDKEKNYKLALPPTRKNSAGIVKIFNKAAYPGFPYLSFKLSSPRPQEGRGKPLMGNIGTRGKGENKGSSPKNSAPLSEGGGNKNRLCSKTCGENEMYPCLRLI